MEREGQFMAKREGKVERRRKKSKKKEEEEGPFLSERGWSPLIPPSFRRNKEKEKREREKRRG